MLLHHKSYAFPMHMHFVSKSSVSNSADIRIHNSQEEDFTLFVNKSQISLLKNFLINSFRQELRLIDQGITFYK
ncbi:unnamed protein product [Blepharisma stoltei]|uniref:Uncharacterized protein n=1 Tax=Blepharisma stoltei TaxID=1481888 RepID=A0AAU9JFH9_9CILI|nr:unnamed protein product [Blepharisma stoltei]